jgi:hypothetical protein
VSGLVAALSRMTQCPSRTDQIINEWILFGQWRSESFLNTVWKYEYVSALLKRAVVGISLNVLQFSAIFHFEQEGTHS